jgi:penicillin-binding protein-related factor A (putative recombinase)
MTSNFVYELKLAKKKSIPLNSIKEHQVEGLLQAKKGQYIKLQDMSAKNGFANPKPYDCLWVYAVEAYVGICWYIPRKPKYLHLIAIDDWIRILKTHPRKSIREEEVESVSRKIML